jgi:hypothetical protein
MPTMASWLVATKMAALVAGGITPTQNEPADTTRRLTSQLPQQERAAPVPRPAYLLHLQAVHQWHYRYLSRLAHIKGEHNVMAND